MVKHIRFLIAVVMLCFVTTAHAQDACDILSTLLDKVQAQVIDQGQYDRALSTLREMKNDRDFRGCSSGLNRLGNMLLMVESFKSNPPMTFTVKGVSFTMIAVKGGAFWMGAEDGDKEVADSDRPRHSVTLSDFYLGETEVTQALWEAVMGGNPSQFKGSANPVEMVSWEDCQEFVARLNALTDGRRPAGRKFRLPTEAEWEYGARGGDKSKGHAYSGSDKLAEVAWYYGNSQNSTHPVKSKCANELGLYDMSGNVYEWCEDWYDSGYYRRSPSTNPCNTTEAACRVLRGGSWVSDAWHCRVAYRDACMPTCRFDGGLRLAL